MDRGDFTRAVRGLCADLAKHPLTEGLMSSDQAMRGFKAAVDAALAMLHVAALEDYARAEPLPWSSLFAARGRCLANASRGEIDDPLLDQLKRIRAELVSAGFKPFVGAVDAVLTA